MNAKLSRWRYALAIFAISGVALSAAIYPRLARYRSYNKIVSRTDADLNLTPQPMDFVVGHSDDVMHLAIGYADIGLPRNWAMAITTHGPEQNAIQIGGDAGENIVFMPPFFDAQLSADGNYSWTCSELNSHRVSLAKIFMMSKSEFTELMGYTVSKSLNRYNQNGIGCFATEHVRGFIHFGPQAEPGNVHIKAWSNRGKLSQGILISSRNAETASKITQCVVANLKYSIDDVPTGDVLQTLIRSKLGKHDLFRETTDEQ
ncbi:hypothetical protein [Novipirellula caenicola]|uniref:Uncharacterized protein n=1 Tax=Novipirellula caenicola TaxID=1536901 RepID=A0ABP9VZQ1_9BACT